MRLYKNKISVSLQNYCVMTSEKIFCNKHLLLISVEYFPVKTLKNNFIPSN